jgi:hypothetical protein
MTTCSFAPTSVSTLAPALESSVEQTLDTGPSLTQLDAPQQPMGQYHYSDYSPTPNIERNDTGLPDNLKSGIESLSGYAMDDVKVHYNSQKPAQLQAHAYAQGSDIHLASGQAHHLPHEAWHVVQQKQGRVQTTTQYKSYNINENSALETEADVMGERALHYTSAPGQLTQGQALSADLPFQLVKKYQLPGKPRVSTAKRKEVLAGTVVQRAKRGRDDEEEAEQQYQDVEDNQLDADMRVTKRAKAPMAETAFDTAFDTMLGESAANAVAEKLEGIDTAQVTEDDRIAALSQAVIDALTALGKSVASSSTIIDQSVFVAQLQEVQDWFGVEIINYEVAGALIKVTFKVNPTYQVAMNGAQRIGLQMLGTDTTSYAQTNVKWRPSTLLFNDPNHAQFNQVVGWKMLADPLSQDHQKGMISGKNTDQDTMMDSLAYKKDKKTTQFIKGHLLNDHLGGPAVADNLFPITAEANAKHVQWMEKYVKADINSGYVCRYYVEIVPDPASITPVWTALPGVQNKYNRSGYTVDSTIKCEFSRLDMSYTPIPISVHNVDIMSQFYLPLQNTYDPKSALALTTNNRYGNIHNGAATPTAGSLGAGHNEKMYHKVGGYTQSDMHTATMGQFNISGTPGAPGTFVPTL